jgi:ABC-type multidrug transport system fused ATPase/permease subunit
MIGKVMDAPINLYFDVTPIGRILNRFSKDLSVMEQQVMWPFGGFLVMLYQTLAVLIVATIVVKWIIILLPILVWILIVFYSRSI